MQNHSLSSNHSQPWTFKLLDQVQNSVFEGIATIGKSSKGWFLGFKLHLLINHQGGLLGVKVTPAHTDDQAPVFDMAKQIRGKLFGDKGHISKALTEKLRKVGVKRFTTLRSNMKTQLITEFDHMLLKKVSVQT